MMEISLNPVSLTWQTLLSHVVTPASLVLEGSFPRHPSAAQGCCLAPPLCSPRAEACSRSPASPGGFRAMPSWYMWSPTIKRLLHVSG